MKLFLTSSPTGSLDGKRKVDGLDHANKFVHHLKMFWKDNSRVLMIAAFCENYEGNDEMTTFFKERLLQEGFTLSCMDILDDRREMDRDEILSYDCIFLAGGHVPTENAYFKRIHLKDKMKDYDGIVIGISAGSMNAASVVYAQPEESGESIDPNYERFIDGLHLTDVQVLPHYQMVKHYMLDGKRLFEDITYEDSYGRHFIALEDGSYVFCYEGSIVVYGASYMIHDGMIERLCHHEEEYVII